MARARVNFTGIRRRALRRRAPVQCTSLPTSVMGLAAVRMVVKRIVRRTFARVRRAVRRAVVNRTASAPTSAS